MSRLTPTPILTLTLTLILTLALTLTPTLALTLTPTLTLTLTPPPQESRKLTDTLRAQQTMGDARVLQLKQEKEDLQAMQDELLSEGSDTPALDGKDGVQGAQNKTAGEKKDVRCGRMAFGWGWCWGWRRTQLMRP